MSEAVRATQTQMPAVRESPAAARQARAVPDGGLALGNQQLVQMPRRGGGLGAFFPGPISNQDLLHARPGAPAQPKLEVARSDDPREAEADQVAEKVVAGSGACACGATCAKCSAKMHRKTDGPDAPLRAPAASLSGALGAGQAMEPSTRALFETQLGRDFADVRVHTGKAADRSAADLRAHAYTAGRDIVFREERYAPHNSDGKRLLAHELAHVVQQEGAPRQLQREEDKNAPPKSEDNKSEDNKSEDNKSEDNKSEDNKSEDNKSEDNKSEEKTPEGKQPLPIPEGTSVPPFEGRAIVDNQDYLEKLLRRLIIEEKKEYAARQFVERFGNKYQQLPGGTHKEGSNEAKGLQIKETMASALVEVEKAAAKFKQDFTQTAKGTLDSMLESSEKRGNEEKKKYGLEEEYHSVDAEAAGAGGAGAGFSPPTHGSYTVNKMNDDIRTRGLAGAARDLSAKHVEIAHLQQRLASAQNPIDQPYGYEVSQQTLFDDAQKRQQAVELEKQLQEKEMELTLLRQLHESKYPILAAFAQNKGDDALDEAKKENQLNQVGRGPGPETTAILIEVVNDRLANIAKVREGFPKQGDVWKLPVVIAAALKANGYGPDSFEGALSSVYMSQADDDFTDLVLTVLSIGLGLALAIPTGGASIGVMAASGAMVLVDVAQIYRDVEKYQLRKAAANTDFDRARSVCDEEPSLLWLAFDIILTVAGDIDQLKTIFKRVKVAVVKALSGTAETVAKDTAEIRQAVRAAKGPPELEEAILKKVAMGAESKGGVKRAEKIAGALGEESRAVEKAAAEAVETTKSLPNQSLKSTDIEAELEHLARSGGLKGPPGSRAGKLGKHQWIENGSGRWCRYSTKPLCVLLPEGAADLEVGGRLGQETVGTAEHKAATFTEYQDAGGALDFETWGKGYDETVEAAATLPSSISPPSNFLGSDLLPPLEAPQAGVGSWYGIPQVDAEGRRLGVDALLNASDLSHAPRGGLPNPPGWESGLAYNRTHLGAHELGFPDIPENLTTAARETNTFGNLPPAGMPDLRPPNMRQVEMQVADALRAGQTVRYRVVPIYHGSAPMPAAYIMQAQGTGPNAISIDTVIRNWTHHH